MELLILYRYNINKERIEYSRVLTDTDLTRSKKINKGNRPVEIMLIAIRTYCHFTCEYP